jgi:hypothetical protein
MMMSAATRVEHYAAAEDAGFRPNLAEDVWR